MHLYKNNSGFPAKGAILMIIIFAVFLAYFYVGFTDISDEMSTSDIEMLSAALENAVVTCYAIEGAYPENLEYIEKHYGVIIDKDRYFVDYNVQFANLKPSIAIYTINNNAN